MRGSDDRPSGMLSYLSPEQRVQPDHPLRAIRRLTDQVLAQLSPQFTAMYSRIGRPSIPRFLPKVVGDQIRSARPSPMNQR